MQRESAGDEYYSSTRNDTTRVGSRFEKQVREGC